MSADSSEVHVNFELCDDQSRARLAIRHLRPLQCASVGETRTKPLTDLVNARIVIENPFATPIQA